MSVVPLGDSLDSLLLHTLLVHNIPHDVLSLVDELWCANMLCYILRSLRRTNIGHPLTLLLMCLAQWGEIISHTYFPCKASFASWFFNFKTVALILHDIHSYKCIWTLMLNKDESFTLSKSKPLTRPTYDPTYVVRSLMQLSWYTSWKFKHSGERPCGNASVFPSLSYKMRHDTTRASARVVSDAFYKTNSGRPKH